MPKVATKSMFDRVLALMTKDEMSQVLLRAKLYKNNQALENVTGSSMKNQIYINKKICAPHVRAIVNATLSNEE